MKTRRLLPCLWSLFASGFLSYCGMNVELTGMPGIYDTIINEGIDSVDIYDPGLSDFLVDTIVTDPELDIDVPDLSMDLNIDNCLLDADISIDTSHWILRIGGPEDERVSSVTTKPDGSIIVAGIHGPISSESSFWLITIDGTGRILAQQVVEGIDGTWGMWSWSSVIPLHDCGLLLSGITSDSDVGGQDLWLARLDMDGEVVWQKVIGGVEDDYSPAVIETSDGGFLLSATTESFSTSADLWLLKLNSNATVEWQISLGGSMDELSGGWTAVIEGDEGRLFAHASTTSFGSGDRDPWVVSLDMDGNVLWQKALVGPLSDSTISMMVDEMGPVLVGQKDSNHPCSSWVVRMTGTGDILWQKAFHDFGEGRCDEATRILPRGDGGYLVAGHKKVTLISHNHYDFWLASLNEDGSIAWQRFIGDDEHSDILPALCRHQDGLILVGQRRVVMSPSSDPLDVTITRLGLDGTFSGRCSLISEGTVDSEDTQTVPQDTDAVPRVTQAVIQDAHAVFRDVDVPYGLLCPE